MVSIHRWHRITTKTLPPQRSKRKYQMNPFPYKESLPFRFRRLLPYCQTFWQKSYWEQSIMFVVFHFEETTFEHPDMSTISRSQPTYTWFLRPICIQIIHNRVMFIHMCWSGMTLFCKDLLYRSLKSLNTESKAGGLVKKKIGTCVLMGSELLLTEPRLQWVREVNETHEFKEKVNVVRWHPFP